MKALIYLLILCSLITFDSCHTIKKLEKTHTVTDKSVTSTADSTRKIITHVVTKTDSSHTVKADSSRRQRTEKIDIDIEMKDGTHQAFTGPDTSDKQDQGFMNTLIKNALNNAAKLKVHIERTQSERAGSTTTQQNALKTIDQLKNDSSARHNNQVKNNIKKKDDTTHTDVSPAYGWIPWAAGLLILIAAGIWAARKFL